ncbi:hypothetical protein SDJN03_21226, partial [Cucurbita argyrosperma subsp. sororia]
MGNRPGVARKPALSLMPQTRVAYAWCVDPNSATCRLPRVTHDASCRQANSFSAPFDRPGPTRVPSRPSLTTRAPENVTRNATRHTLPLPQRHVSRMRTLTPST